MIYKTILGWIIIMQLAAGAEAQNLYFPPASGNTWESISPQTLNWCSDRIDSLYAYLDSNNTKAFILLKDGKIVLEKYFGTQTQSSLWYWASAGKSLTAFMVGLAQQDGYLSINDTASRFLGQGWTSCPPGKEEKITIRHQLTMTSGLDDGVADPYCTDDTCLKYLADAGTRWAYHNGPYTLLDSVIHAATGSTLNNFLSQKLSTPTGISGLYYKIDYNNIFFSTARVMARFGLLMLNHGKWDNTIIMSDTSYFNHMISSSQNLNPSYGYLWWLNGQSSFMVPYSQMVFPGSFSPSAPADMYAALGKNGQFINVVPSQNMVWIRMGDLPETVDVPFLLNEYIWQYINQLTCTGIENYKTSTHPLVSPNPAQSVITVTHETNIGQIRIYNASGELIYQARPCSKEFHIDLSATSPGLLYIVIEDENGIITNTSLIHHQ